VLFESRLDDGVCSDSEGENATSNGKTRNIMTATTMNAMTVCRGSLKKVGVWHAVQFRVCLCLCLCLCLCVSNCAVAAVLVGKKRRLGGWGVVEPGPRAKFPVIDWLVGGRLG